MRILKIKNVNCSVYYFYMNMNIEGEFQIYPSVPKTVVSFFQLRIISL